MILDGYAFKTEPMAHQLDWWRKTRDLPIHALFHEQRTGKTKIVIDTAGWLYQQEKIDALLIVAPSGVHSNWIGQECPIHLPDWTNWRGMIWRSSKAGGKNYMAQLGELIDHEGLSVLAVNVDALITDSLRVYLRGFVKKRRVLLAIDEASDVKSPSARRSKLAYALASWCPYRRILEGTPAAESPLDLYGQLRVLEKHPLGFTSPQEFNNTYARFEKRVAWNRECYRCGGPGHGVKCRACDGKGRFEESGRTCIRCGGEGRTYQGDVTCPACEGNSPAAGNASGDQVCSKCDGRGRVCPVCEGDGRGRYSTIAVDAEGRKEYLNLDDLQKRLAKISSRVLRSDCADLPPKIYSRRPFELSDEQRRVYDSLRDRFRVELSETSVVTAENVLTRYMRLQQVTCGFIQTDAKAVTCSACDGLGMDGEDSCARCHGDGLIVPDGTLRPLDNPKLDVLAHELERLDGQVIIWSRFRYELGRIADRLADLAIPFVAYHGGTGLEERERAKMTFQEKRCRIFLGNQAAAGRGLLLPADHVIYVSNTFALRQRLQSEDRAITLADTRSVAYLDLVAEGTIDELPLKAFSEKRSVSEIVMDWREWL